MSETRRNPEMEKYVEIKPVAMEGFPDAQNVFLRSTNQQFCVSKYACETMEESFLWDKFGPPEIIGDRQS